MIPKRDDVVIIKMNARHEEVWRYEGRIIARSLHRLLIEAFFNLDKVSFHGVTLRRDDRSIECFYNDRWYNIFEIHDRDDDRLKAWYCNIAAPAEFTPGKVAYVDLALDVLVFPDGDYLVLDENEFVDLALDDEQRIQAQAALNELIELVQSGKLPEALK